jgi:FkbM family methyltransferase
MFLHQGIWLPEGERHFPDWMSRNGELVDGRGTYQIRKFREAMKWCRDFRTAVDVGAHVGLWSMQLAKRFHHVDAFEPMEVFRECFAKNIEPLMASTGVCNVALYPVALGAAAGVARMAYDPADSGGTHVGSIVDAKAREVKMATLDSYALREVDFLKIDCEGYELEVLKGAADTLERCRPTVIVEQKPAKLAANYGTRGAPAVDFLTARGWKQRREMGGDFILSYGS